MLMAVELKKGVHANNRICYLVGSVSIMHTAVKFFSINYIISVKQIDGTMQDEG